MYRSEVGIGYAGAIDLCVVVRCNWGMEGLFKKTARVRQAKLKVCTSGKS